MLEARIVQSSGIDARPVPWLDPVVAVEHPGGPAQHAAPNVLEQVQVHLVGLVPIVIACPPFETILHVHPRLGVAAQPRNIRTP